MKTIDFDKFDGLKRTFLEELEKAHGVVSIAAKNSGITRQQTYNWRNADTELAQAWEDIRENAIDYIESIMLKRIAGYEQPEDKIFIWEGVPVIVPTTKHIPPSESLLRFYMATQAKHRGYTERTEVEHVNQIQVQVETVGKDPGE